MDLNINVRLIRLTDAPKWAGWIGNETVELRTRLLSLNPPQVIQSGRAKQPAVYSAMEADGITDVVTSVSKIV